MDFCLSRHQEFHRTPVARTHNAKVTGRNPAGHVRNDSTANALTIVDPAVKSQSPE